MENVMSAKKVFSKFGIAYLGISAINIIASAIIVIIGNKISPEFFSNPNVSLVISCSTMYLLGMTFAYFYVKDLPKCELPEKKLNPGRIITIMCSAYAIGSCSNIVGIAVNSYIGKLTGHGIVDSTTDMVSGLNLPV